MNASKRSADRPKQKTKTLDDAAQLKAFRKAARELGTDESEATFDAALGKIAKHKPVDKEKPAQAMDKIARGTGNKDD